MTTSKKPTSARSFCASHFVPAIAVLALSWGAATSNASEAGRNALNAKLTPTFIPGLKTATDIVKAKPEDLMTAISLVQEDPAPLPSLLSAADIAESALEPHGGAVRKDKDKIAGQVVATAIATDNLSANPAAAAEVVRRVFSVNAASGNSKFILTATGKGAVVAAAAKTAANDAVSDAMGNELAVAFAGRPSAELEAILTNAGKLLGSAAPDAAPALSNISQDLFGTIADTTARKTSATKVAAAIAAKTPTAAGAVVGGFFNSLPLTDRQSDDIEVLGREFRDNPKVNKALGDIIANISEGHLNKTTLIGELFEPGANGKPVSATNKALVTQGVLRVTDGAANINAVLDVALVGITDRAKFGGTITVGTGDSDARVAAIVAKLAIGQDVTSKTKILTAVATSLGLHTPDAAGAATDAILAAGGFTTDEARTKLATDTVGKIKSTAAAGAVAKEIVEANVDTTATVPTITPAQQTQQAAEFAAQIMVKGTKAATDIARTVSGLSFVSGNSIAFADAIADTNKGKFALNAAVGTSITDSEFAGKITAAVITHSGTADKKALGGAAKIGGAVATAVDVERSADIAKEVSALMSVKGDAGKPIKLATVTALATALGKAIQAKPGIDTKNRMDELGEVAAALTLQILGENGATATDTKAQKAETKLITAIGTALIKTLSKKPFNDTLLLQADLTEAADIAGSIAQVIFNTLPDGLYRTSLIGAGGALEKAFAKLAGKPGTPDAAGVVNAIGEVRGNTSGTKYEDGTPVNDPTTDSRGS